MDLLLRRLARTGLRQTLAGGGWAWLALAAAAYGLRRARRPVDDAVSVRVRPGERLLVSLQPPGHQVPVPSGTTSHDG